MSDTPQRPGHAPGDEAAAALRAACRAAVRRLAVLLAVLVLLAPPAGALIAGGPGAWGAAIGAGLGLVLAVLTAVVLRIAADRPTHVLGGAVMGGWLAKMVVVGAVLILVRDLDLHSPPVLLGTLVLAILGIFAIEVQALLVARVPTITPGRAPAGGEDRGED